MYTDAIIGVYGQTLKSMFQKTGCYIFVPKDVNAKSERVYQLSGTYDSVERCKLELLHLIQAV